MGKLELRIHDISTVNKPDEKSTISLIAETETIKTATIGDYTYSLVGLSMDKQMYQPTAIVADISIRMIKDEFVKVPNTPAKQQTWIPINKDVLGYMFLFRKVTLVGDDDEAGDDFYVHEVIPEYMSGYMTMRLHIFSPDKMLTLKQTTRSFVGQKLGSDILTKELDKYVLPYDSSQKLSFNPDHMQMLKFKNKDGNLVEHIFPYLVQYNESFYDLLARTTNRWGEFLYYEDGKLQLGYDKDTDKVKNVVKYFKITYSSQDTSERLLKKATDGHYEAEAAYDKSMYDRPVQKSPRLVRGELGKFNGQGDKYAMKKLSSFFNTDKNIVSWIINTLVDDGVSVLQAISNIGKQNDKHDEKYFPGKGTKEQYGTYEFTLYGKEKKDKEAFNQFTEITSQYANRDEIYDAERYGTTLECEQKAGRNMVMIDYDTAWPGLKLGQIIEVHGERFIVVNISATYNNQTLNFQVKASWEHQYADGKKRYDFYPAVIPSGHVRYSGPQIATIKDTDDPDFKHRVRVLFSWQKDADVKEATPWVTFASKGEGRISTGKHNKDDEVIVGFIDGNVERPYVLGGTQTKAPADPTINVDLDTPGSHYLRLTDGTGLGIAKFISGAFSPLAEQIFKFVPVDKLPGLGDLLKDSSWSENKYFEGGVTMSDYYGIYKISASTDQRNVTISSPWGDVKMDAFTGITISAPNGDVKIKGKNVTIEAGNNLKLESGTNVGWKLGNDKKFGDFSLASLGLTVAGAIANKVAEKFKPIDLKIVRSVVEVVMRPVEGALTVKSHRFLKLEAGKNECEYPKAAFNEEKKKKLKDDNKKNGKPLYVGDGTVEIFDKTVSLVNAMVEHWRGSYDSCLRNKIAFERAVLLLKAYSNDDKEIPCKTIEELKDKLWDPDIKKVEIKKEDLGFKKSVGEEEKDVSDSLSNNHDVNAIIAVIQARITQKSNIVKFANALREVTTQVISFNSWTEDKINEVFGAFKSISKSDINKIKGQIHSAFSKDNVKDLVIFKPNDDVKALNYKVNDFNVKKFKKLVCLNMIKELELDKNRDTKIEEPTKDNITDDTIWNSYVNSLSYVPEKKKEKPSLGSTLGTPFKKWLTDEIDNLNFKKSYNEMYAWADAKDGQILIGTKENTYAINGEHNSATFDKVESNHEAQLKKIKEKLLGI